VADCSVVDHFSVADSTDGKPCDTFSLIGLRDILLKKRWILHQIDVFYLIVYLRLSFQTRENELKKQV